MATSIIIVDNQELVREALVKLLQSQQPLQPTNNLTFSVLGEAGSGQLAVQLSQNLQPEIVLFSNNLLDMDSLQIIQKVNRVSPNSQMVMVTETNQSVLVRHAMTAGVRAVICKQDGINEFILATQAVLSQQSYISTTVAKTLALQQISNQWHAQQNPFEALSARELQTGMMIVNGQKVADIADHFNISPKTVNSYRYRIFEKLRINNDVQLALLAIKHQVLDLETLV